MKIKLTQLRRIIKEEVMKSTNSRLNEWKSRIDQKVVMVDDTDPQVEKGQTGTIIGVGETSGLQTGQLKVKWDDGNVTLLSWHAVEPLRESKSHRKSKLSESMSRITEDEMAAWKKGDWGYVAGDSKPGHDHQEFLHGSESGHPMDDEGYMIKSRMASMKKMASDICDILDTEDQLPGWVQDLVATSHNDLQHVHDYLMGDLEMRKHQMTPKAPDSPTVESRKRGGKRLAEGHNRVTEQEMREWLSGNWGFVSEISLPEEKMEECPYCHGDGVNNETSFECRLCKGTGQVPELPKRKVDPKRTAQLRKMFPNRYR